MSSMSTVRVHVDLWVEVSIPDDLLLTVTGEGEFERIWMAHLEKDILNNLKLGVHNTSVCRIEDYDLDQKEMIEAILATKDHTIQVAAQIVTKE